MPKETINTLALKAKDLRHDFRNLRLETREVSKDHEQRLRDLEKWQLKMTGKLSVVVTVSMIVGTLISRLVTELII